MEDIQIIDLYWLRDEGAIRETDSKYGAFCQRIAISVRCPAGNNDLAS